jgi:hypothetical protein
VPLDGPVGGINVVDQKSEVEASDIVVSRLRS